MFRKLLIDLINTVAALLDMAAEKLLDTAADMIGATPPPPAAADMIAAVPRPPAADRPRLRVVAPGRLCLRLLIVSL